MRKKYVYLHTREENIWKRDHRMLLNLYSFFFFKFKSAFISSKFYFYWCIHLDRLEDSIIVQPNEVTEDGIPRNVDDLSEVDISKPHCTRLNTFWKVVNMNLFYLDSILIENISCQSPHSFKKCTSPRALGS